MEKSSLADEVIAEIELGMKVTARKAALRLSKLKETSTRLKDLGLVHRLELDPYGANQIVLTGIAATSTTTPAFGGSLYGINAVGHTMIISGSEVLDSRQITRVKIGDIDYYGQNERLRWHQIRLAYQVLESLIEDREIKLILIDLPLFISRLEETTVSDDTMIAQEWSEFVTEVNSFWSRFMDRIYPFNPNGTTLASLRSHAASSLFAALNNNLNTTPDSINPGMTAYLKENWTALMQLGQSRILDQLLQGNSRTVAYSYEDLDLDPRWQPGMLSQVGILGFFLRAHSKVNVWHLQVPGHKTQWSVDALDRLSHSTIHSTLFNQNKALPLPLWFAKRSVIFPKALLQFYQKSIQKELSND